MEVATGLSVSMDLLIGSAYLVSTIGLHLVWPPAFITLQLSIQILMSIGHPGYKVARPFFKQSREWRESFRDCHLRIAMRIQKGLDPQPNCTGEEMAFHNIMSLAPDADDAIHEEIVEIPENPNDDEYGKVRENGVEDEDVLMLFETGDDDDDDEVGVDNPVLGPGSVAAFMLGSPDAMRVAHLHPLEWFHAFKEERFRDHLPSA